MTVSGTGSAMTSTSPLHHCAGEHQVQSWDSLLLFNTPKPVLE